MFEAPRSGTSYVAPVEPIDVTQRYLVRLVELHDLGVSRFPGEDETRPAHRIAWDFTLSYADTKQPVPDVDGNPYKHVEYTSNRTGKGNNKVAVARQYMEALMGRPLEDAEITPEIHRELVGKVALALFEEVERTSATGEAYNRLKILRLAPYKAGRAAQPAAAPARPAPRPMQQREAVGAAAGREPWPAPVDDVSDLPF